MSFEIGGEYDAASKGFQHVNHIEMNDITIFLFAPAPSSGWCAKPLFKVAKNGTENFSHPIWDPDSTPGVHISELRFSTSEIWPTILTVTMEGRNRRVCDVMSKSGGRFSVAK